MSALVLMPCGRDRRAGLVHAVPRLAAKRTYASGRADLIDQGSVRLIVGEPARTVEDRKPPVRVCVNAHGRLDEVTPMPLLGDLQHAPRVADRVVVPHHALRLDTQDVVERAYERHKGRPLLGDRETG